MKKVKNTTPSTPSKSRKSSTPAKTPFSEVLSSTPSSPKSRVSSIEEKRFAIMQRLRRGDLVKLSVLTGYDQTHVGKVIRGIANNPSGEIVNAAYKFVGKRKPVTA